MRINIGSTNPIKVQAVEEILQEYEKFKNAKIMYSRTRSGVSEQPMSLGETVTGAINRAKKAYNYCDISFGIESGLMEFPESNTGYINHCIAIAYDGKHFYPGTSSGFEFPIEVVKRILHQDLDANQAAKKEGITDKDKLGSEEGLVGILTQGKVTRKDYIKQAIRMALIPILNPKLYNNDSF